MDENTRTGHHQQPLVDAAREASGNEGGESAPNDTGEAPMVEVPELLHQQAFGGRKYAAYTVKLPVEQLAALQSIWLELKRLYGTHSPDKSGMIQLAISDWLQRWEGPERQQMLRDLLEIREDTRKRQYRKL